MGRRERREQAARAASATPSASLPGNVCPSSTVPAGCPTEQAWSAKESLEFYRHLYDAEYQRTESIRNRAAWLLGIGFAFGAAEYTIAIKIKTASPDWLVYVAVIALIAGGVMILMAFLEIFYSYHSDSTALITLLACPSDIQRHYEEIQKYGETYKDELPDFNTTEHFLRTVATQYCESASRNVSANDRRTRWTTRAQSLLFASVIPIIVAGAISAWYSISN